MAISYELKPGERINEGELSRQLGGSRTPLREALNRLSIEGFLSFEPGKGFFSRRLDPKNIFDLYETRKVLETSAVRLAVERARGEDIQALEAFLKETGPEAADKTTADLVELDETFHERLMAMSGNDEMLRLLKNINARINFVRFLDFDRTSRPATQAEHVAILEALKKRDVFAAVQILEKHIDRRMDQINDVVRKGIADLYLK